MTLGACATGDAPAAEPAADPIAIDAGVPAAEVPVALDRVADRPRERPGHARRAIELLLQSTPSGALAAVDGVVVGTTPAYWEGEFTGRPREFTFARPGYGIARYQFVPMVDGIVHGRLQPMSAEAAARALALPAPPAGARPPEPPPPPDAAPPPTPPDAPDVTARPDAPDVIAPPTDAMP